MPALTTSYTIREAGAKDSHAFLDLVAELARFEKLPPPDEDARDRLVRDAFGPTPKFDLYVAEESTSKTVVAYGIILWTYSSFLAKPTMYIEDIYVTPKHRVKGLGTRFLRHLAAIAHDKGCGRIEGIVLDWNAEARKFYKRTGAREMKDWILFRYDEAALNTLAQGAKTRS
jgi:GNAT superfamily N-acetyltransferase